MKLKILKVTDNPLVAVRVFLNDGTELPNVVSVAHCFESGVTTIEFLRADVEMIDEAPTK